MIPTRLGPCDSPAVSQRMAHYLSSALEMVDD